MRYTMQSKLLAKLAALVLFASLSLTAGAADPKHKADYERLHASVKVLSEALVRDPAAAGGEAKANLARVAARQKEAEELAAVGEYETARSILDEGYRVLTRTLASIKSGSGYAGPSGNAAQAGAKDAGAGFAAFDSRLATTKALVDALKRQNKEKAAGKDADIAAIETRLQHAQAGRNSDLPAAQATLDLAYKATQSTLQALQTPSAMKTGSAALEAGGASSANAEVQRGELDRLLRSSGLLRDAVARKSTERGADNSGTLSRIDSLLAEARSRQATDLPRALQAAGEANQAAKDAMAAMR